MMSDDKPAAAFDQQSSLDGAIPLQGQRFMSLVDATEHLNSDNCGLKRCPNSIKENVGFKVNVYKYYSMHKFDKFASC